MRPHGINLRVDLLAVQEWDADPDVAGAVRHDHEAATEPTGRDRLIGEQLNRSLSRLTKW
jgi:hypothetical protein